MNETPRRAWSLLGAWSLVKKDFFSFCRSWVGVSVLFSYLLVGGIFFTLFLLGYSQLSLQAAGQAYEGIEGLSLTAFVMGTFILNSGVLFLFMAPLLSMRSLAEEKRVGTLELLYTYPLSDFGIVLGKYLALMAELALLFLPTLLYTVLIRFLGPRVDGGILLAGVLGFFLLGGMFLAIGLFFSSLTENQILAALLTFMTLLALWIFEWLAGLLPQAWAARLGGLSPFAHFRDFPLGIVDLTDVAFFISAIAFFFFLTLRKVEARNWKG